MIADTLNAISNGGITLMLFIMLIYVWRELIRSRRSCESKLDLMQAQQIVNITKIANLEGQVHQLTPHPTLPA